MINEEEKFEDRYGSDDFEQGKGANPQKLVNRKEKVQMKQYGIKPTDTFADKVKKVIAEEMPKQEIGNESNQDNDDEDEEKDDDMFDEKEELRIKMMQALNPRIAKSKELKNFMNRKEIKEDLIAALNELATHKLDLYKKALAVNAPVELNERIKENKAKKDNIIRQIGAHAYIQGVRKTMQSPKITGRDVVQDPEVGSKQVAGLYRNLPNPTAASAEDLRQQHYTLHEETEQLDEASKNVIKQGRTKIVKARVRGGKVQRRKRVSAVKGYTIRGGKLKRMSAAERIRRKRGQRIGKVKRKAKMARALMRRKRSMRRRASLGLKE